MCVLDRKISIASQNIRKAISLYEINVLDTLATLIQNRDDIVPRIDFQKNLFVDVLKIRQSNMGSPPNLTGQKKETLKESPSDSR